MILPTIIGLSEAAIRAVPQSYYEGALSLGATHERAVFTILLPAAKSGIFASVILGIGRAIGETMAVVMVAGNQARIPTGILNGVRTMTSNIVIGNGLCRRLASWRTYCIRSGLVRFHPYIKYCIFFDEQEERSLTNVSYKTKINFL